MGIEPKMDRNDADKVSQRTVRRSSLIKDINLTILALAKTGSNAYALSGDPCSIFCIIIYAGSVTYIYLILTFCYVP